MLMVYFGDYGSFLCLGSHCRILVDRVPLMRMSFTNLFCVRVFSICFLFLFWVGARWLRNGGLGQGKAPFMEAWVTGASFPLPRLLACRWCPCLFLPEARVPALPSPQIRFGRILGAGCWEFLDLVCRLWLWDCGFRHCTRGPVSHV